MRTILACCILAALALALPLTTTAQDADIIVGTVTGPEGSPVVGARVEAMSLDTEILRSTLTDENGRYNLLFPDGGGAYLMRVSMLGMETQTFTLLREGAEELLLANVALAIRPIQLDEINITTAQSPDEEGGAGEEATELTAEMLQELPLGELDPAILALLVEGVIATAEDSTGQLGFSVAGMSDLLNQITLDGMVLEDGEMGVPEEGVRVTRVTTNTFDVSRGGFAGGQVSMRSARGGNRWTSSLSYRLDDDALQLNSSPVANAFTRHNVGGSIGGPLIQNKLFMNTSVQFSRNVNHRFSLAADDPLATLRSGVVVDSIARFLSILETRYGIPAVGETGAYDQRSGDLRLQGRIDWNIVQEQDRSHTLSARLNTNINNQDSTRINSLDVAHHGGDAERNSRSAALTLTSRFGGNWTNTLRASLGDNWSDAIPYMELPEGFVRVTSDFEDGTRGTRDLVFGGNRSMPNESSSRNVQLSDDLSVLLPIGTQFHRLRVGGSLERSTSVSRSTSNLHGTFWFPSLADFEANRPERFERALTEREIETGRLSAGLHLGDTWRPSEPLELTLGLRWDYSRLEQRPGYNPAVEAAFGRRTDITPSATSFSPRVGFNYRLNERGERARSISGGIGLFAGRAPTNIFSAAARQTGLPNADLRLICIGAAVPVPDWDLYLEDPSLIPSSCADGHEATVPTLTSRAPTVTLIDPDQRMPTSVRFNAGYRTSDLPLQMTANLRYTYSRGIGLWGYRDLNLDESRSFVLGEEQRPFFGDPSAIVPQTGAVSMNASRRFDDFGNVYDITSTRHSSTHQISLSSGGPITERLRLNANYTLSFSRDQGSGSFAAATTAANPNEVEWGTAGNDRRHTMNLTLSHALTPSVQLTAMSRISSGSPFTPMVNRDINGDGVRNDRAYIFDPAAADDLAIAAAMTRLLDSAPARVRACLEAQMGRIADRNSCRNGWTASLDLRAQLRPVLPRIERRLTISIDGRNALTGLDQLINGSDAMKGWGIGQRADATLLEVRGYDPATNRFLYEVNEGFGQARRGPNAFRNPFSLTISARMAIGGQSIRTNRGFGRS